MATITLNKIVAVEKGVKSRSEAAVTAVYHGIQRTEPLSGIARSYKPKDDEGDQLPSESTRVQVNTEDLLKQAGEAWIDLLDVVGTKDFGNQLAKADVIVDGKVIVKGAPVSYLLFLEKKLDDVRALIAKLPVLNPSESWHYDENAGAFATEPSTATKSKKVFRNHVRAEATKEHAAQVEVYTEDVLIGYWTTVKFSGAVPQTRVNELRTRLDRLQDAVKLAREEANTTEVEQKKIGKGVIDFLLA